jgi:hypothetical protein
MDSPTLSGEKEIADDEVRSGQYNGSKKRVKWTAEEDQTLTEYVQKFSGKNWKKIALAAFNNQKTDVQCLHRWQKVSMFLVFVICEGFWRRHDA